jgi:uncharacterized protein YqjF (DUF2071 family)
VSTARTSVWMRWHDLLFLHWEVELAALRRLVPSELEIDCFDGRAYVGLVPFEMRNTRFRGVPNLRSLRQFPECNVRTYVRHGGESGVWFFSLDATSLLAVIGARLVWRLPYVWSSITIERDGEATPAAASEVTRYHLRRVRSDAGSHIVWRKGGRLPESRPGSLEHFLTERYWLFSRRLGRIWRGRVVHAPWSLRSAEVLSLDDTLVAAAGLAVTGAPLVLASDGIDVEGMALEPSVALGAASDDGGQ